MILPDAILPDVTPTSTRPTIPSSTVRTIAP